MFVVAKKETVKNYSIDNGPSFYRRENLGHQKIRRSHSFTYTHNQGTRLYGVEFTGFIRGKWVEGRNDNGGRPVGTLQKENPHFHNVTLEHRQPQEPPTKHGPHATD